MVITAWVCSGQNPGWQPAVNSKFTYTANVLSIIKLDSIVQNYADDRIAFFAENEIRGLSQPVEISPGKYIHFINIYSSVNQENLTIKVFNKSSDKVYEVLIPFVFKVQTILGNVDAPYELNIYIIKKNVLTI